MATVVVPCDQNHSIGEMGHAKIWRKAAPVRSGLNPTQAEAVRYCSYCADEPSYAFSSICLKVARVSAG